MNLGKAIVLIREKEGTNQSQLAAKVGISQTAMSQIETGRSIPSAETLEKIAATLNVDVAYIKLVAIDPDKDMSDASREKFNELFPDFHKKLLSFIE